MANNLKIMVICSLTVYISFDWIDRYNNNVYTLPQYRKKRNCRYYKSIMPVYDI